MTFIYMDRPGSTGPVTVLVREGRATAHAGVIDPLTISSTRNVEAIDLRGRAAYTGTIPAPAQAGAPP